MVKKVDRVPGIRLLTLAITLAIFTACDQQNTATKNGNSVTKTEAPTPADPIEVKIVDGDGMKQIIQKHLGNVVLLDYWATW